MSKTMFAGAFLSVTLLSVPVVALAAELRTGEQPTLGASEQTAGNFYIAGGNVTSNGNVQGDIAAAGGNVLISGPIAEDVAAAGGSITILSDVAGDERILGGNIIINGRIGGDLAATGGQVQLSGAGVGGDVLWGGGSLRIDAPVAGNLELAGGNVFINAPINGNVRFRGETLTLGSAAVIGGNLTYSSPKEAVMQEGAVVKGEISYEPRPDTRKTAKTSLLVFLSVAFFLKFLMTLAGALVLGLMFKRYSMAFVNGAAAQPLLELGRGFAALVFLPAASVVFLVTVIGIPLGALGLIGFAGIVLFASIAAPILLGSIVRRWISKSAEYEITWGTILLGAALFTLLMLIPLIGWLAKFALVLMAIGSALKIKWDVAKNWL